MEHLHHLTPQQKFNVKNINGMVLLTALLFLIMLTFLVLGIFETSLLQTKMSQNFYATTRAFHCAEAAAIMAEKNLDTKQAQGEGGNQHCHYNYHQQLTCPLHHYCYLITAHGQFHWAQSEIKTRFMLEWLTQKDGSRVLKKNQQSWWQS